MTQRRTRRKPGENRERLLQAGLHEFGLYGYHGTSTARISARAEVPQPHLYANFDGKIELFLTCLDVAINRLAPEVANVPTLDTHGVRSDIDITPAAAGLIVYQAVAAVRDPVVGNRIQVRLDAVKLTHSTEFERTLGRAARDLTLPE